MSMHAVIHVYTFKDGLLSKLAHDLKLRLEQAECQREGKVVRVICDTRAWTVVAALEHGVPASPGPSDSDRRKIVQNIREDVLRSDKFPTAEFQGEATEHEGTLTVQGTLTLCGVSQPLRFELARTGSQASGSFELIPSRFGIRPYRALGGALKVQDRARIEITAQLDD